MKKIVVFIWRKLKKLSLKRKKIILKGKVFFNANTKFEDNTLVNEKCHIYNSFIGRGSYLGQNCFMNFSKIGRFCSIGNDVHVVIGKHPIHDWISTHPAFFSIKKQAGFSFVSEEKWSGHKKNAENGYECIIGNDVWIGDRVTILSGVKISDGCVLGAGAILTKSTEPYGIYVGVPAKKIGQRFNDKDIEKLKQMQWWNFEMNLIKDRAYLFETVENINLLKDISNENYF